MEKGKLEEAFINIYESIDYSEFDFTSFKLGVKFMEEQMEKLKDFDTWKEWKNTGTIKSE